MKTFLKSAARILLAVALAGPAVAQDWSLKDWLKELDAKINRTERKQKQRLTAVAAVRGAKTEEEGKLYWMGRRKKSAVTQAELDQFKAALALVDQGKDADGQKALAAFKSAHPDSALKEDVERTLQLLAAAHPPEESVEPAGDDKKAAP